MRSGVGPAAGGRNRYGVPPSRRAVLRRSASAAAEWPWGWSALARFDPRKPLDHSQQGVVALLAAAILLERCVERVHQRAAGEGDVLRKRALEDEAEVFLLEVDHEARPEVPGEHLRGVVLHRPRGSRAAGDDLPGALEIDAL